MTKSLPAGMKAVVATAFLIALPLCVEAAKPAAERKRWTEKNGVLKCIDADGKVQFTVKKGVPTYESKLVSIPADYRSVTFLVLDKGKSAVVFDYNNGGTTVTFHVGGCAPTQTSSYPKLQVYRYVHILAGGSGLVAALSDVNIDFSEDFENSGYIIQWDSSGDELMKAGPYEIARMYTQNIKMFGEDRYGSLNLGSKIVFFNFLKAKHFLYEWPKHRRGGKHEFTAEGDLRIFELVGWKTKEGKIIPNDGTLRRLSPSEYDKISREIEPVYRLEHEHRF